MDSSNWRTKREPSGTSIAENTPSPNHRPQLRNEDRIYKKYSNHRSRQADRSRGKLREPLDKDQAERKVEEGRRLWVGNMPYEATVQDVESLFKDVEDSIEAINMSVDPMTGRNPSYCFVDFKTKEQAEHVMSEYNGREFMRRTLGVKPGVKRGTGTGRYHIRGDDKGRDRFERKEPLFNRWTRTETPLEMSTATEEGRRVWLGSLPYFDSQADSEIKIRHLFESNGLHPKMISKVVSNHAIPPGARGNFNYCFVDFESASEAQAAVSALNGMKRWGDVLRLNFATGTARKIDERERIHGNEVPEGESSEGADAEVPENQPST